MTSPTLPPDGTPFVLLDDARPGTVASARLYRSPVAVVTTRRASEIAAAFDALRTATNGGLHAAGYVTFEAGYALGPFSAPSTTTSLRPLIWFGLFRDYESIPPALVAKRLPDSRSAWVGNTIPEIDRADYDNAIARIKALISAGDIYQANLTFSAKVPLMGHPLAVYAGLRTRSASGFGGVVHDGRDWHLSCSPELFFTTDGARIVVRPMKGTAARGASILDDERAKEELCNDPKQRAENLMIVDLLRNDLSRVAKSGSVNVRSLFDVETYPTIHQLTSTISAELPAEVDAIDVLKSLFPCGSITGAPKIRAMEIIRDVEWEPRGVYTGSVGRIDPGGRSASFNVAIRTIDVTSGRMGLGSGIVADSQAAAEWDECLAKAAFVASPGQFDLMETMRFDPHAGLCRLEGHLERMRASAEAFCFRFDRHAARNELQAATFRLRKPARVRLLLGRRGSMAIAVDAMPQSPIGPVPVAVRLLSTPTTDFRLRHKTTDRAFYDDCRRDAAAFEVVLHDDRGRITEGSFTNVFVARDDVLLTPPLTTGLLGGVLRGELIACGKAREADLRISDLDNGFFIGNSLRGLLPACKVEL